MLARGLVLRRLGRTPVRHALLLILLHPLRTPRREPSRGRRAGEEAGWLERGAGEEDAGRG
eukprot:488552-Rhodomonas_salina.2